MSRSRLGLLGLCAVVLGVMAFSASAAQAEAGAKWLILSNGIAKTGEELPSELIGSAENNDLSLLTKVVGIKVKILCTGFTLIGAKLQGAGSITPGFKIKLTGCLTALNEEYVPECEAHSPGQPNGTIISNELKALTVLHEPSVGVREGVLRIEPLAGVTIFPIVLGPLCPVGNNLPIIGKLYLKDCEGKFTTHLVKHLLEELKALTKMWAISETAEHVATLDGSFLFFLTGAHTGLAWGGMPG